MQANLPYITICHSVGKFFPSITSGTANNIGQCIAFVGDRTSHDPLPIALPDSVWNWIVPLVYKQQDDIIDFYEDTDNYGTLFYPPLHNLLDTKPAGRKKKETGTATNTNTEVEVPYLLSLPMCIATCLLQRTYWMPNELLLVVKEKIGPFRRAGRCGVLDYNN
jgi:hypothetical protein